MLTLTMAACAKCQYFDSNTQSKICETMCPHCKQTVKTCTAERQTIETRGCDDCVEKRTPYYLRWCCCELCENVRYHGRRPPPPHGYTVEDDVSPYRHAQHLF